MPRRLVTLLTALVAGTAAPVRSEALCSLPPITYAAAKAAHPDAAFALAELEARGIATWYSDREENGDYVETARQLVAHCPESSRLSIVVYGLPNKDCEAGYSTTGSRVRSAADYALFISTLANIVGQRKVLYVLEPDAVGLLVKGGCAAQSGYKENLKTAIRTLTENKPSAQVYVDVGYWTLGTWTSASQVASVVKELGSAGRVKGITLNTSNYRSSAELAGLCAAFQRATGYNGMNCIIDTSRNYNGAPASSEWCNVRSAGIGKAPTASTGFGNIDYFVWIKPPGDSDGTCSDSGAHTWEAMRGPGAGVFFPESFKLLWNQGSLVQELGLPKIDGTIRTPTPTTPTTPTPAPMTPMPTPAPATPVPTSAPAPTTLAPTPEPTPDDAAIAKAYIAAQLIAEAQRARENATRNGSTSTSSSSSSAASASSSSARVGITDTVESQSALPLTPRPLLTLSPPPRPESETRGASTTSVGTSAGVTVGLLSALVLAGIATVIGVVVYCRTRRARFEPRKSLTVPFSPAGST